MTGKPTKYALMGALACGLLAPGAQADDNATLRAELSALRAEVAQMRDAQSQNWMNERRAEEVRGLVREVLADADTRSTLLQDGLTAGYDNGFFIGSADGNNRLNVNGLFQFRWIGNFQDDRDNRSDGGFQNARTRLIFDGVAIDGRFNYYLQLSADRGWDDDEFFMSGFGWGGNVSALDVKIGYDLSDTLSIHAGSYKLPFQREFLVNPGHQLAVERSISSSTIVGAGRSDQVALTYQDDSFRIIGSVNDGTFSNFTDFNGSWTEFAATARADLRLAGQWSQWDDFTAWSGQEMAAFVGAAAHWEIGDGAKDYDWDLFTWTVDGSVAVDNLSAFGSFTHIHWSSDDFGHDDYFAAVLQGGYNINDQIQPFVRWEWIDLDTSKDYQALTAGANWFLSGHNAKLSADLVWAYRGDFNIGNTQVGLLPGSVAPSDNDEFALRAQFQLMF